MSDLPSEVDLLNYADYRDALVAVIERLDINVPLTIGVFGAWGSGKTTLLRLIEKELKRLNDKEPHKLRGITTRTVWVEAWSLRNEEEIWAAFLQSLLLQIRQEMRWYGRFYFYIRRLVKWQVNWRLAVTRVLKVVLRVAVVVLPLYFPLAGLLSWSDTAQTVPGKVAAGAGWV